MEIKEFRDICRKFRRHMDIRTTAKYNTPLELLTDLMEEVGELARAINRKEIRKEKTEHDIGSEIIDIALILMWMADIYGIDFEEQLKKNLESWNKRFEFSI